MSSRREFEQNLNQLPPEPYQLTADLRRLHELFHQAKLVDPPLLQIGSLETPEEILALAESIGEGTKSAEALELLEEIRINVSDPDCPADYGLSAWGLAHLVFLNHHPPGRIDHKY